MNIDSYRIIPYLEDKGLKCQSVNAEMISVSYKTKQMYEAIIMLSCSPNMFGGITYIADYKHDIKQLSDELRNAAKDIFFEKYKYKCFLDNFRGNPCLNIKAQMVCADNKKPEVYCYHFLLEKLISAIDEVSALVNKENAKNSKAFYKVDLGDYSIFEKRFVVYCSEPADFDEARNSLSYFGVYIPFDLISKKFLDIKSQRIKKYVYDIDDVHKVTYTLLNRPPFKITVRKNKQIVLDETIFEADELRYYEILSQMPCSADEFINNIKEAVKAVPFAKQMELLGDGWILEININN